jgi:hypothetical protein
MATFRGERSIPPDFVIEALSLLSFTMTNFPIFNQPEPLAVDPKTAANLLNSSTASLEKDRATGHLGVPYVKAGRRVIYRLSDLDVWLKANRVVPSPNADGGTA